jgi:cholesterol oxidase
VDYDYLIIGSGFGGSVSACRLTEKGYRVAVLEAGKRFRDQDFPKTAWNVFRYLWLPRLGCYGIMRITPLGNMLILSGTGVGGGSLGYACTLLEPPDPFYQDPQWSGMQDWKTTLAPHYATATQMLGVTPCTVLTKADEVLKAVAEDLGRGDTFRMQDVGVYFGEPEKPAPDPFFGGRGPDREGCHLCGGCMVGCRNNAKNTLPKNYLYLAEAQGAEVFPETTADLIRPVEGGYAVDTHRTTAWFHGGKRTFTAQQVVLAAGVLGTLPLLFRCRERGTLPLLSPMLGHRVRTNSEALAAVTAKNDAVDYSHGVAITSSFYPDAVTHVEPVRYPRGSDLMSFFLTVFVEGGGRFLRPLKWLWTNLRHPITSFRVHWPFKWARRSIVLLVMQTLDNSLQLLHRRRWWWPFRKRLATAKEKTQAFIPIEMAQAQAVTKLVAARTGGIPTNSAAEVLLNMGSTAHILGGCPIGPSPECGVVDGQNRIYGHEGLYVVDGSVMPANLGVNPSLTITALAEHAMSHIPPKAGGATT